MSTVEADKTVDLDKLLSNFFRARSAVVAHSEKTKESAGIADCPICESGELKYMISSYNGHIHAGCTTEGCVDWCE